jgi:hypothetical protein
VDRVEVGETALVGWRVKVADAVAEPLAERTPLSADTVRAILGATFFLLSVYYVAGTIARAARAARSS